MIFTASEDRGNRYTEARCAVSGKSGLTAMASRAAAFRCGTTKPKRDSRSPTQGRPMRNSPARHLAVAAANQQAARIILVDVEQYDGPESHMVRWAHVALEACANSALEGSWWRAGRTLRQTAPSRDKRVDRPLGAKEILEQSLVQLASGRSVAYCLCYWRRYGATTITAEG